MRILLSLTFILISVFLDAQVIYSGNCRDVGSFNDVVGAKVYLKNDTSTYITTNIYGDFILKYGDIDQSDIQFFDNAMIWKGERPISLRIAGLDGRILFNDEIRYGDYYLFPRLDWGIYMLLLKDQNRTYAFKMIADANQTIKVDKRGANHTSKGQSDKYDTLVVEKNGYYPREIVVPAQSQKLAIGMLKGSYEHLDFFNELTQPVAYDILSSHPARSNLGDVKQVKIILDTKARKLYYMNSKKYALHLTFATEVLNFDKGHAIFNQTQYTDNSQRYLYLASLNYYQGIDQYVLQFVTAVQMNCSQIQTIYDKILATSFLTEKNFSFFPIKPEWSICNDMTLISSAELHQGQTYQGLNIQENYGYLTFIRAEDISTSYLSRREIVVTDGIPNDLPVVAGIITSDLQTPLSHINVLSYSRNTPNMALKNAWTNEKLRALEGRLVYLSVKSNSYELRETNIEEANSFWRKKEPSVSVLLDKDVSRSGLIDMTKSGFRELNVIGGKAANFAEMLKVPLLKNATPERAIAIPFFYYQEHLLKSGLDLFITQLLNDDSFKSDAVYRKSQLKVLQDSILKTPVCTELLALVSAHINNFQEFDSYRFRSSTNAEDLEEFSGAGLYDSYSAKKGHSEKTIDNAIRKVWASLWNWRAFEEREYFKIDHQSCAMGILVHRSFPDEDANGVLISKNLYNDNPGYILNAQYKEHSIVFPEPGVMHDQMILFTWSIDPNEKYMLEYLTFSNIPELNGRTVLKKEEVFELGDLTAELKKHFYYNVPHDCRCAIKDFGLDIEFKVDSDITTRKVYVKQVRRY